MIDPIYFACFKELITDVTDRSGIELPYAVGEYCTALLAEYTTNRKIDYAEAFAIRLMGSESYEDCKTVGDDCLMLVGAFPNYGNRRGISRGYYIEIGKMAYTKIDRPIFLELVKFFEPASEVIKEAVTGTQARLL